MSAFELERLENIRRNQAILRELGLDEPRLTSVGEIPACWTPTLE